jgi:hypothetical protein
MGAGLGAGAAPQGMNMMQKLMMMKQLGNMGGGQPQRGAMMPPPQAQPMGQPSKIPMPPDAMNRMSGGNPAGLGLLERNQGIKSDPNIMAMIEDMMRRGRRRI